MKIPRHKMESLNWKMFQNRAGFSDEEIAEYKENPKTSSTVENLDQFMKYLVEVEVVASEHCLALHHKGDKFYLEPTGTILTGLGRPKICLFALGKITPIIMMVIDRLRGGLPMEEMLIDSGTCSDVGCKSGGWGEVTMQVRLVPRSLFSQLSSIGDARYLFLRGQ